MGYIALFFLCCAEEGVLAATVDKVSLVLLPELCVTDKAQGICYESIRVSWHATAPVSSCLYYNKISKPLQCWEQENKGDYIIKVHSNRPLKFWLEDKSSLVILASARLNVLSKKVRKRRRKRHAWSIF